MVGLKNGPGGIRTNPRSDCAYNGSCLFLVSECRVIASRLGTNRVALFLKPGFVKLGTDADNKEAPTVNTIPVRDGAAAPRKAMANIIGQPHAAKIQILVVDEHPLFREGAVNLINQQVDMVACGNADAIPSVQSVLKRCKPDLVLLGLQLGTGDTLEFIKALKAQCPELRILVFSQFEETLFAERALRAGASGYLMKHAPNEELLTAIHEIVRGEIYVSRKIAMLAFQKSLETPRKNGHQCQCNHASIENLSDREIHVFQLLGSGLGTKKIAEALNLSAKTIESHRENIKRKLGLHSGVELTGLATGWVTENFLSSQKSEISVVKKKKVLPFRAA